MIMPVYYLKPLIYNKKSFQSKKSENIQKTIERNNYIDAKTQNLETLGIISFIFAIMLGAHNIDFAKKLTNSQKFGLGLGIISISAFIAKIIKTIQLSKEYEKENNV